MLNACLSWWHYVFGRHRSEPKLQINIQMDFAHVHVAPAIGEWTRSQDHPWLVGERDTQSFGDHIEARALDFLFHEYSQADLSFFFFSFWEQVFSAMKLASADSVSAGICEISLSFYQDYLFLLHCLGSLGSLTFLWLTADSYDCLFKFF